MLAVAILLMLSGLVTDGIAVGLIIVVFLIQKFVNDDVPHSKELAAENKDSLNTT